MIELGSTAARIRRGLARCLLAISLGSLGACASFQAHPEPVLDTISVVNSANINVRAAGHRGRLDALHAHLAEPRRALDCFVVLFGRQIDDGSLGLATGEALAHLRNLEIEGRAVREVRDGVYWYRAIQKSSVPARARPSA